MFKLFSFPVLDISFFRCWEMWPEAEEVGGTWIGEEVAGVGRRWSLVDVMLERAKKQPVLVLCRKVGARYTSSSQRWRPTSSPCIGRTMMSSLNNVDCNFVSSLLQLFLSMSWRSSLSGSERWWLRKRKMYSTKMVNHEEEWILTRRAGDEERPGWR